MNQQGDEPKAFDVKRTAPPPPTSRPLIVGHQPAMPDPMIHQGGALQPPPTDINPAAAAAAASPLKPSSIINPLGTRPNPDVTVADQPQPTPEPAAPQADLKVHLPAGEAAHSSKKTVGILLALVAIVIGFAVGFLVIK